MNCKYCHSKSHLIDKCPTIICKTCKEVGHPQWLCMVRMEKDNYKKMEDIKKKQPEVIVTQKNIVYYSKMTNIMWSDLVEVN